MEGRDIVILLLIAFIAWKLYGKSNSTGSSNSESWYWVDYRGNERYIEVARHVH